MVSASQVCSLFLVCTLYRACVRASSKYLTPQLLWDSMKTSSPHT